MCGSAAELLPDKSRRLCGEGGGLDGRCRQIVSHSGGSYFGLAVRQPSGRAPGLMAISTAI